jgi:hypothetical protein
MVCFVKIVRQNLFTFHSDWLRWLRFQLTNNTNIQVKYFSHTTEKIIYSIACVYICSCTLLFVHLTPVQKVMIHEDYTVMFWLTLSAHEIINVYTLCCCSFCLICFMVHTHICCLYSLFIVFCFDIICCMFFCCYVSNDLSLTDTYLSYCIFSFAD